MTPKNKMLDYELTGICQNLITLALQEDLGDAYQDLTTDTLFQDQSKQLNAVIKSKHPEPMVLCGAPIVKAIIERLDVNAKITSQPEGSVISPGDIILQIRAKAPAILKAERLCLNILRSLCACATYTRKMVDAIAHTTTTLLDTRKTIPGMRAMQRYAVICGGGRNHRMGLYDAMMIKDTHIGLVGDIAETLHRLPEDHTKQHPVIIEVRNEQELNVVLQAGLNKITRILLDNMPITALKKALAIINNQVETEASGNINLSNIVEIAELGVNYLSVGCITHSCGQVDLSMQV